MPGRKYEGGSGYRFGFNGQEKSDDIAAGHTTALYWEYDSRIGRRWNIDPVIDYSMSPYACFNSNPVFYADPQGDCPDCPKSYYLGWAGVDFGSFGNGFADGLIGAAPEAGKFAWDLAWDGEVRSKFISDIKTVIADPLGTAKLVFEEKMKLWGPVLTGSGTEQQKYEVGKEMGTFLFWAIAGGGLAANIKELKKLKLAKKADAPPPTPSKTPPVNTTKAPTNSTTKNTTAKTTTQPVDKGEGKRSKNKLKPAEGVKDEHSSFARDDNGDIYKYETYKKETNPNVPLDEDGKPKLVVEKRFDGGKPDGSPGMPHDGVPTPHMNNPGGKATVPEQKELPNNKRFKSGSQSDLD